MSPVLSTFSGASARAFGLGYNFKASAFELIETQTVGAGGTASITFSSIPGTYKHLELRWIWRSTESANVTGSPGVQVNGTGGTSYSSHYLLGDGSTASSSGFTSQSHVFGFRTSGASATANVFGAGIMQILDYANTTKNKTFRALNGVDVNGAGSVVLNSGAFLNTNAITSVTFDPRVGNIAQYSTFSLYGCK